MLDIALAISILITVISLVMVLYTFNALSTERIEVLGVVTQYFLLKRRHQLLRLSLILVAGVITIQLINSGYMLFTGNPLGSLQLLFSDVAFIALVVILAKMYRIRISFQRDAEQKRGPMR